MKHVIVFLSLGFLLSPPILSTPFTIGNLNDCHRLGDIIKSNDITQHSVSKDDLSTRFAVIKKFSAGKGGAYVALVRDIVSGENKVLKIYPTIEKSGNKYNYREPYYTCINGFITYSEVGIVIDPPPQNNNVFPRLFEVGLTNSKDMKTAVQNYVFPYMIFEFVQGHSLAKLGEKAAQNHEMASKFQLHTKEINSHKEILTPQSEGIIYQIAHLLYKLKDREIFGTKYQFHHADLNVGNVMIKHMATTITLDAGFGAITLSNAPVVTFIDFGHSTSNLDDNLGTHVTSLKSTYHKSIHMFSSSTGDFYKNLNGKGLSGLMGLAIGFSSAYSDIRLFHVMTRALFDSGNYTNGDAMRHFRDCKDLLACVSKAPMRFEVSKTLSGR